MLINESGPFAVFRKIRSTVGVKRNTQGDIYGDTFLAQLFSCLWCMSIWVGIGVVSAYYFLPYIMIWIYLPFVLSDISIIVDRIIE
jgi:hypothetical protein